MTENIQIQLVNMVYVDCGMLIYILLTTSKLKSRRRSILCDITCNTSSCFDFTHKCEKNIETEPNLRYFKLFTLLQHDAIV